MNLLFDQNISFRITQKLINHFPKAKHVSDCDLINCEDVKIWSYAKINNFVIVTFDSDFYDFSMINGHPPKIIWLRINNQKTDEIANCIIRHYEAINLFINDNDYKHIACLEID
jgi:predicted nuclease of predicted toxin-antitoxin system